ncbi:MAG TPA: nucleoside triphosphate pyrophosphohydrolase family protein [Candidatus Paceibacterota bacterium]
MAKKEKRKGGMEFNEYQDLASQTADFTGRSDEYKLMYTCMGLAGETGETIEKVKKVMRNNNGVMTEEQRDAIKLEIGDVLWYLSQVARFSGIALDDAAQANVEKLADRRARGVIRSEGDKR